MRADGCWGRTVRGIYAYKAQGPDEIDVDDGGLIQLTEGPNGGRRYGEGWWEGAYLGSGAEAPCNCCCPSRCPGLMGLLIAISGIDASGKQGIFPSNYVSARSDKSREAPCTDSAPSNPNAGGGCAVAWPASIGSRSVEKQLEPGRTRRRWAMCYAEEGSTVGPRASVGHTDVLQTRNAFVCNFFCSSETRRRALPNI